ncbi:MAG: hypothetical protein H6739_28565 [Alphaproteobacteria bacterium]|nr:hypothetical protein [Alphaproteobacteria bacterium]
MSDAALIQHYRSLILDLLRGRKVILGMSALAGMQGWIDLLQEAGAQKPLLLCETVGTGDVPSAEDADWIILADGAPDMMTGIRMFLDAMEHPTPALVEALDRYDPDRSALVLLNFLATGDQLGGRPRYAPRPPAWTALEDKVGVVDFWDRHGLPHAPSRVVPARGQALRDAHATLDQGLGTAWAGDNKDGFNGGATYLRWVRAPDDMPEAIAFMEAHADRVRVMPFVEGVPCSIHGVVFPDTVAVFRPNEMISLRRKGQNKLLYSGAATFWDPPEADREALRDFARRAGAALRAEVGFRGAFTLDGVMGADGFVPTELNTRFGGAMNLITVGLEGFEFFPLCLRIQNGDDLDYRPTDLERLLVAHADAHRAGGGWCVASPQRRTDTVKHGLVWTGEGYRLAGEDEETHGRLLVGPASAGTFVRFFPDAEHTPVGPSLAPRVVAAWACVERELGVPIGPLEAAREVRG